MGKYKNHLKTIEALIKHEGTNGKGPRTLGVIAGVIVISHETKTPENFHKLTKLSTMDIDTGLKGVCWNVVTERLKSLMKSGDLK